MNKLWAEIRFEERENAKKLISAFFKDFNPSSSIALKDNKAKLEIVFQDVPTTIIDAIKDCEVIELSYGKSLKENETTQERIENDSKPRRKESKKSKETEHLKEKATEESDSLSEVQKKAEKKKDEIPELEGFAAKASSFEEFAGVTADWLEMGEKKEFFKNLILVSTEVDKIKWEVLEEKLKSENIVYKTSDKLWCSKQVSNKLKERSVTLLQLLKEIAKVKKHFFEQKEIVSSKSKVKMACMPKCEEFEETLAKVDKSKPLEERIRYVLNPLGLSNLSIKQQHQIVEIACVAVKKDEIVMQDVLNETGIPSEDRAVLHMTFSKMITDFVQKYDKDKKIKISTFLSELKEFVR